MATNKVAVLDVAGYPTGGVCTQEEAHFTGVRHAEARLCMTNGLGHILQAQRGERRGLPVWDLFLVCGDVFLDETPVMAIRRMLGEQFGLSLPCDQTPELLGAEACVMWEGECPHSVFSYTFAVSLPGIDERSLKLHGGIDVRRYPKWQLTRDLERPEYARVFTQHVHRESPVSSRQLYYRVLDQIS